jgi:hypothetical protein
MGWIEPYRLKQQTGSTPDRVKDKEQAGPAPSLVAPTEKRV